jgi:hypothetical protein
MHIGSVGRNAGMRNASQWVSFGKWRSEMKLGVVLWLALVCGGVLLGGCQPAIPDRAIPVTANLADYELVGSVKKVIHEDTQRWSSEYSRFISTEDGLEVWEFNQAGYLTRRNFGLRIEGEVDLAGAYVFIMDPKNRLHKFMDVTRGKTIFEVSYVYKESGNVIEVLPVDAKIYEGEGAAYYKYRQIFEGDQIELWIDDHDDKDPSKPSRTYLFKDGLRMYGRFARTEKQYSDGRLIAEIYSRDGIRTEDHYEYEGAAIWPKTHKSISRKGQITVDHYEYILDDRGNWIERKTYRIEDGKKRLIGFENRSIEYY